MGKQKTLFIEIIMGVILGVVLVAIGEVLAGDLSLSNYRMVLLVIGLLIFAELYLGLVRYHQTLEVAYPHLYLYYDISLGLLFVAFIQLIKSSVQNPDLVAPAMLLCAIMFIFLAIRNIIPYSRIQDLETKLDQTRLKKINLQIPIVFNIAACITCIFIYLAAINGTFLGLDLVGWAWTGFFMFMIYVIAMNIAQFSPSLRAS
jgi:hypothetical protein